MLKQILNIFKSKTPIEITEKGHEKLKLSWDKNK